MPHLAWEDGLCKNPDMDEDADELLNSLTAPVNEEIRKELERYKDIGLKRVDYPGKLD